MAAQMRETDGFGRPEHVPLADDAVLDTLETLERASQDQPDDAQFYNRVGVEWSRKGLFENARECFALAVELSPDCARYWYNLGTAYHAAGQPLHAAKYYEFALNMAPEYRQAYQALKAARQQAAPPPVDVQAPSELPSGEWASLLEEIRALQESVVRETGRHGEAPAPAEDSAAGVEPSRKAPSVMAPGLVARMSASLVDLCLLQVASLGCVILVNLARGISPSLQSIPTSGPALLLTFLAGIAYLTVMTYRCGQTIGMQCLRLQVVDAVGNRPTLRCAALRSAGVIVDLATAGIGYFWMSFDPRRQALHDKIASTYVVGRRQDPGTALIWIAGLLAVNCFLYTVLVGPQFTV